MRLPERVGDQVRIGVALLVPEPWGSLLQAARASFGDPLAALIPPHVTVVGPTVLDPEDLPAVDAHLADVCGRHAPFTVHLRGTGTFRPVSDVVFVQVVCSACDVTDSFTLQDASHLPFLYFFFSSAKAVEYCSFVITSTDATL